MSNRKSIRLPDYNYSQAGEYFITICVKNKSYRLGSISDQKNTLSKEGEIVDKWIKELPIKYEGIIIEHYIIMPNHIHFIIEIREHTILSENNNFLSRENDNYENWRINRKNMLLPKIINYLKSNSAREINRSISSEEPHFWQANYYEHVIRNEKSYQKIAAYIENNPLSWEIDLFYSD